MKKRIVSKPTQKLLSVLLAGVMLLVSIPMTVIGEGLSIGQIGADDNAQLVGTTDTFYEDVSMRDEFSKHYVLESGERYAVIFPEAVHYEEDGEWKEVDNRLTYNSLTGKYVSANPMFTTTFAANASAAELVSISHGEYTVSWGISFAENSGELMKLTAGASVTNGNDTAERLSAAKAEQASLARVAADTNQAFDAEEAENVYKNTVTDIGKAASAISYGGSANSAVSLRYSVAHGKVEEDIILRSKSDFTSYTMTVNTGGLTVTAETDGSVIFKTADGETVFTIDAPWMKDSAYGFSKDIAVTVTQTGNTATVTYTPSAEWLNSEERVYPVLIDPTVTTNEYTSVFMDTYILSGDSDFTYYENTSTLYVGMSPVGEWTTYIRLTYLPDFNDQEVTITDGNLIMASDYYKHYPINMYETTSRWHGMTNISPPSVTPLCGDKFPYYDEDIDQYKYYFDLWMFFENINNTYGADYSDYISNYHYGFMINAFNTSADDVTILDSTESASTTPMLTVTYTITSETPSETLSNNYYTDSGVYIFKGWSNFFMEVDTTGTKLVRKTVNNSTNQTFRIIYNESNNSCKIKSMDSYGGNGKVVGFDSSLASNGAIIGVKLFDDTSSNNENSEWLIEPIGSDNKFIIKSKSNPDFKLTVGGATDSSTNETVTIFVTDGETQFTQEWEIMSGGINIKPGPNISLGVDNTLAVGTILILNCAATSVGETVTWYSSNHNVAVVDNGVITGLDIGSVVITARRTMPSGYFNEDSLYLNIIASSSTSISTPTVYYIKNALDGKVMEPYEEFLYDIVLSESGHWGGEEWLLIYSDGYYKIENVAYGGFLTVCETNSANLSVILEDTVSNPDTQLWNITKLSNGNHKIQSKYCESSDMVLAKSDSIPDTVVLQEYTNDTNYNDEWIVRSAPKVLKINIYADAAYRTKHSNYSSRILTHMEKVKEIFLDEFNIEVQYSQVYSVDSLADECDSLSVLPTVNICNHATEDECINSDITRPEYAQTLHHNNHYNILTQLGQPDITSYTKVIFLGNKTCEKGKHNYNLNGKSWSNLGMTIITNFGITESECKTILHEILHWYGAPDHYGNEEYDIPSTLEMGEGFNEYCIFGEKKEDGTVLNDLTICEGCKAKIRQNLNRFDH